MSKTYIDPSWPQINRYESKPIEEMPVVKNRFVGRANTAGGYVITNGAKLNYYMSFNIEYDDHTTKSCDIYNGSKIYVSFNKKNENGFPEFVTVEGIVSDIKPVTDGFTFTVDASSQYNSSKYTIGSKAVLDIGLSEDDEDKTTTDDDNSSDVVVEITSNAVTLPPLEKPAFNKHLDPADFDFYPNPSSEYRKKKPEISWTDKVLDTAYDEHRKYNVLNIVYAKKAPVDVLLVIYDTEGNVVYKALDNSKKVSMSSHFVWSYRDYNSYIKKNVDLIDRLDRYTLDSAGNFVMTSAAVLDAVVKEVDESNECFPEATQFFVELVTGEDLLSYVPMGINPKSKNRYAIAKRFDITAAHLKAALAEVKLVDDTTEPSEPENPDENAPTDNTEVPSTDSTEEPSTGTEEPKEETPEVGGGDEDKNNNDINKEVTEPTDNSEGDIGTTDNSSEDTVTNTNDDGEHGDESSSKSETDTDPEIDDKDTGDNTSKVEDKDISGEGSGQTEETEQSSGSDEEKSDKNDD